MLFIHEGLALNLASQEHLFLNINFNTKSFNSLLHFHIHEILETNHIPCYKSKKCI